MHLTKIELHGFKSFADKTELEIGKGVTCLVGPNGCGKSNIVDAVKWTLGEQRVSALRGDQMADVIFKGNGRRPAMGFAEVTLLFNNEAGELPIDAAEVAITRRLLRTGESGYLINRRPCRLKDIRELFVDTGLGQNAYSVLEQGRIDAVLSANSQQRRAVFEEAAGIQRFRMRKREASHKLEKVDQNLLRVADLIDELEKRVRSLRIQAGRARSYVALSDRLTELRTTQFLSAGAELAAEAEELAAQLAEAGTLDRERGEQLAEATRAVEEADAEARVLRESVARQKQIRVEAKAELENADLRKATLQRVESEARQSGEIREGQARDLEREGRKRSAEIRELEVALEELLSELREAEQVAAEGREALNRRRAELTQRDQAISRLGMQIVEWADRELALSNTIASLDSRALGLSSSRERLVRREAEISGLLERDRIEAQDVEGRLSRLGREAAAGVRSVAEARAELARREETGREFRGRISAVVAEISGKQSRRETLDGVIEKMEGVEEGARALVKAARQDSQQLPGVRGLLAELLPVARDRARAVDAALGHLAVAVVVEDRAALERCLSFLRENGQGAATFLVLDRTAPVALATGGPGEPLVPGVEISPHLTELFQSLLGGVRMVEQEADLFENLGTGRFLVTREGARLESTGAFTDRPKRRSIGFVERMVERDQLATEVLALKANLLRLQEEEARVGAEITEWTAVLQESELNRQQLESGIQESRSNVERLRDRAAIYRRELTVSAHERLEFERDSKLVAQNREATASRLLAERASRRNAESERSKLVAERELAGEAVDELAAAEASSAQEAVRLRERERGVRSELTLLRRGLEEMDAGLGRIRSERAELARKAEQAAGEWRQLDERITSLLEQDVAAGEHLAASIEREEQGQLALVRARERAMEAAEARETARQEVHDLQLQERGLLTSREALRERAREEISLDIDQEFAEFDPSSAPASEEVAAEISSVRDKISRIGNVNLDAIHELEEVEARLTFLVGEKQDLDRSRKSLEAAIAEMDSVSRVRFLETFEEVRGHFKTLFRKLFHGGRADIQLEEGVDVLEAGIDIIAAPPGKDARSITLLSGGERTLTAVGLLFALFKAKPAPVAILDEVDAALDEENTERFCSLLDEFVASSQFMIVTHSKRTMSHADTIFGVTMEESGISKRVGICLEEYEERVA
ncbi:MAG: chromosome segregation protein SMC [Planctomycetota bacterium]